MYVRLAFRCKLHFIHSDVGIHLFNLKWIY